MFSARCRRYMMAYPYIDENDIKLADAIIKRLVKVSKKHQNISDQEESFIQKVILDSISL